MELIDTAKDKVLKKNRIQPRYLFEISDLSDSEIKQLFKMADTYAAGRSPEDELPQRQVLGSLFFQSSTRTRLGFESAAQKLGLNVVSVPSITASRSDSVHQESIQDAVRVIQNIVDIMVVRTSEGHWYESIRDQLTIPVINGGDGNNQHPTQALSDMWFASRAKGDISNLRIGLVGTLGSRVHRSVIQLLCSLRPKEVGIFSEDPDIVTSIAPFKAANIPVHIYDDLTELTHNTDVVEVMPLRMPDLASEKPTAISEKSPHAILPDMFSDMDNPPLVLHPGPRSSELPDESISCKNVPYFEQVRQAIFMKMAIYHFLLQETK
jgi:aspartate carbamoyltransferase catalytic subunit